METKTARGMEIFILSFRDRGGHRTILGAYSSEKKAVNAINRYFKGVSLDPNTGFEITPMHVDSTIGANIDIITNKIERK